MKTGSRTPAWYMSLMTSCRRMPAEGIPIPWEMESTVEVLRRDTARRHARVDIPGATITSLAALAPAFRAWPALTELQLDATGSGNFADVSGLESLAQCTQLEVVHCIFKNCYKLANVDALQALGGESCLRAEVRLQQM